MSFQTSKTVKSKMIAPAFVSGSHTNISFTYNTGSDVINASGSLGGGGGGGTLPAYSTISSFTSGSYTIDMGSNYESIYFISNGSTAVTVNLPAAASKGGYKIHVKRLGTAIVVIDANSAETIDGNLTFSLTDQYSSVLLVSDNSNWMII
jgi:hypothetical protein